MPRNKEFDVDRALDRAMKLFWRKGYRGTSLTDLMATMRLSRQSIYGAFGSKRSLYLRALGRYHQAVLEPRLAMLDKGRDPVRAILAHVRRCASTRGAGARGCMVMLTALELAPRDREAAQAVTFCLKATEDAFRAALARAVRGGAIAQSTDLDGTARQLTAVTQALQLMTRSAMPPAYARRLVRMVEAALVGHAAPRVR